MGAHSGWGHNQFATSYSRWTDTERATLFRGGIENIDDLNTETGSEHDRIQTKKVLHPVCVRGLLLWCDWTRPWRLCSLLTSALSSD